MGRVWLPVWIPTPRLPVSITGRSKLYINRFYASSSRMYFMYVDESGDSGLLNSPKRHFILTGLIVHETRWFSCLERLVSFRRRIKSGFGLKLSEELHAYALLSSPGSLNRIKKNDRLTIIRAFADELASINDLRLINVVVDKHSKGEGYDVFEKAWTALIQRFENTLNKSNFPNSEYSCEHGMIMPDRTDDKKLTQLLRKMRRYNPVPSSLSSGYRDLTITRVIEDPTFKDSQHSYFIQAADLVAYLLQQNLEPSSYMRKKSGKNYFHRLEPILFKPASRSDPYGIVRL